MEADDRQVTTLFAVTPHFVVHRQWLRFMILLSSADGGMTVGLWRLSSLDGRRPPWYRPLVYSLTGQTCWDGTVWTWTGQSITTLLTWEEKERRRKKERKKERKGNRERKRPTFRFSSSGTIRFHISHLAIQTLALFRGQLWGNFWDGAERVWTFPNATVSSWAETETETLNEHDLFWVIRRWEFTFYLKLSRSARYIEIFSK